jgi:uncharacterized protein (TIGR04255 family)
MSTIRLPSKLAKEPLIDVIFELRFSSHRTGVSALITGQLFTHLTGLGNIEPLPIAHLPQQIRDTDPMLQFSALSRIVWGRYVILIGDRSIGVGCLMPYPGWAAFKIAIKTVIDLLYRADLINSIDRHSIKYVDFFETGENNALALSHFNVDLSIGKHVVKAENTVMRVEIPRGQFLHAVQLISTAHIQESSGGVRTGAILDVDTHMTTPNNGVALFVTELPTLLEKIHLANKQMFFECLSEAGLSNLEPQYE